MLMSISGFSQTTSTQSVLKNDTSFLVKMKKIKKANFVFVNRENLRNKNTLLHSRIKTLNLEITSLKTKNSRLNEKNNKLNQVVNITNQQKDLYKKANKNLEKINERQKKIIIGEAVLIIIITTAAIL